MEAQRIPRRKVRREIVRGERGRVETKGIFASAALRKHSGGWYPMAVQVRMLAPGEANPNSEKGLYFVS